MYKKIALLSALVCTFTQHATDLTKWFEIKPSYFLFSASPMKYIYNQGGFEIQGSASVPLCNYLDFYGSLGYRKAKGYALNTGEKTHLSVVPIDLGLKSIFNFCEHFYYFFAIGPRFFQFHQHNYSPYVDCIINGGGFGFFLNTGSTVQLTDCFWFGIFGEYSYEKKRIRPQKQNVFSNGSVQIGGFALGVSLGYEF